jgi:hypothetical protein
MLKVSRSYGKSLTPARITSKGFRCQRGVFVGRPAAEIRALDEEQARPKPKKGFGIR